MSKQKQRLNEIQYDKNGTPMKIVKYENCLNIIVEFQDEYCGLVKTTYRNYINKSISNPYSKSIMNIGMIGMKYQPTECGENTKEYNTWYNMMIRCYDVKYKQENPAYKDVTCCKEWLLYENFYEWLHKQENFNIWFSLNKSSLDKDILIKGNKIYSPETCCLVPCNVNTLFAIHDRSNQNNLPIGVYYDESKNRYISACSNPFIKKQIRLGVYDNKEDAFYDYKIYKENIIKKVANIEFNKHTITKECYEAMMNYNIEMTD